MLYACSGRHIVQSAPTTASLKSGVSTTAHSSQMALNLYSMWQEVEKVFPFRGNSGEKCLLSRPHINSTIGQILVYMSAFQPYMKLS